ncbi:amino acid ABC transporter ATP-binding protein [Enterococcus saigonensis]|uniref:Amino acid ABC transporter ATP-binding protein n=1 Tax=Enterococcus saigonensis TaxID=1805431 RepID=A0A679ILR8_9ENTE|nr:YxeA family protein [Enterococcus saigonensis]BCA86505.1 amino acid ABC transporter ATP-binding protein [Enterococcus saigonensis]
MKKLLIILVSLVGIGFVGLKVADFFIMGGEQYYVKITTNGQREDGKSDSGENITQYKYSLPGYDKEGNEKQMDFSAFKDRPLKKDAYLKITWNKNKGVTSYEEVTKADVPNAAKEKLG